MPSFSRMASSSLASSTPERSVSYSAKARATRTASASVKPNSDGSQVFIASSTSKNAARFEYVPAATPEAVVVDDSCSVSLSSRSVLYISSAFEASRTLASGSTPPPASLRALTASRKASALAPKSTAAVALAPSATTPPRKLKAKVAPRPNDTASSPKRSGCGSVVAKVCRLAQPAMAPASRTSENTCDEISLRLVWLKSAFSSSGVEMPWSSSFLSSSLLFLASMSSRPM
mmetsp:Transcript_4110/g.16486  ORF Transcript_4110/g.16486 Transcript_4110/m.16486 type:complete len:232 (-) Transcript_4110:126-821(-)